jgi:hypothetical protein
MRRTVAGGADPGPETAWERALADFACEARLYAAERQASEDDPQETWYALMRRVGRL